MHTEAILSVTSRVCVIQPAHTEVLHSAAVGVKDISRPLLRDFNIQLIHHNTDVTKPTGDI